MSTPSSKKLFDASRAPPTWRPLLFWRDSSEPGAAGSAPADSKASWRNSRSFKGKWAMVAREMTEPRAVFSGSSKGVASLISICVRSVSRTKAMSTRHRRPTLKRTRTGSARSPGAVACSSYSPTGRSGNRYCPRESVAVAWRRWVACSIASTRAPMTTRPDGSRTRPARLAVWVCASRAGKHVTASNNVAAKPCGQRADKTAKGCTTQ